MKILWVILLPFVQANIRGYNFYGCETPLRDFTCSWRHPVEYYISKLQELGFNSIRLPFSKQYVDEGDFSKIDNFINIASQRNMTILLDLHRINSNYQSANPFNDISMTTFVSTWITMGKRYSNNEHVYGLGLFNEFQGTNEEGGYWSEMLSQAINLIETEIPNRYIYVCGGTQWGGNLHNINVDNLVQVDKSRIRYEIHKYVFSGDRTNYEADWDFSCGNFTDRVIVGEWALSLKSDESWWAGKFINYLIQHNITNTYYWTLSNSGDTLNIWENDCETINWNVVNTIKTLWSSSPRHLRYLS